MNECRYYNCKAIFYLNYKKKMSLLMFSVVIFFSEISLFFPSKCQVLNKMSDNAQTADVRPQI